MLIKTLHGPCRHVQPRPVFVKALTSIWMLLLLMAPCAVFVPIYIFCVRQAQWTVSLRPTFPTVVRGGCKKNRTKQELFTKFARKENTNRRSDMGQKDPVFFFLHVWESKYIPSQASLWISAGAPLMFLLGKLWETAAAGRGEWEVREAGSLVPPARQMTSETQQQNLDAARWWVTGHEATQGRYLSLSLCLPYTNTCKSAHTCAQARKWILMWEAQVLHLQNNAPFVKPLFFRPFVKIKLKMICLHAFI